jgi:hypothetical protein
MTNQTTASELERVCHITCKILHKESGLGIPDLIVVLMDVDTLPDVDESKQKAKASASRPDNGNNTPGQIGDRLGSALTDTEGKASFEVDMTDINTGTKTLEKKPDLMLLVLTPEEPGVDFVSRILFISKEIRMNAGSKEAYLVKLESKLLESKGVAVPKGKDADATASQSLKDQIVANKITRKEKQAVLKENIVDENVLYKSSRKEEFTAPLMDMISTVPLFVREGRRFHKPGTSLNDLAFENLNLDIATAFNPDLPERYRTVRGYIYLSDEDKAKFQPYIDPTGAYYNLPDNIVEEDILPKLFRKTLNGSSSDFIMDHPGAVLCRNSTQSGGSTGDSDEDSIPPGGEVESLSDAVIFASVANQIGTATSPEQELTLGVKKMTLEKRPDENDIANSVKNTIFQKGPADVPAYYEFHSLKIAFEHIWQETFDLGLIDHAEKWYDLILGNGGDPVKMIGKPAHPSASPEMRFSLGGFFGDIAHAITGAVDVLGDLVGDAVDYIAGGIGQNLDRREPTTEAVVLEFPESLAVWQNLTVLERRVIKNIASELAGPFATGYNQKSEEGASPKWLDFLKNKDNRSAFSALKSKGKSIIAVAQERIREQEEIQDEYTSLRQAHELTHALIARFKSRYSFKHYAANSRERSVNFGVLLSYQQKWEPLNYQAGELVKTIPLAPLEVRKYSKKTIVKRSRSQKELEENLRISRNESQDTSRAEAEIVNKAANKTALDRNSSSESGVAAGPIKGDGSTTLNLHHEAERDSQQTKKEFHESVVKASQEYKNERKVEITTEETYESEVNESGEISNPNNELTVTYLFYQLQRQFKISERLYRMRPVIMVAQEMPAPHQIDNDWILSYDWILKRVLLDDQFRYGLDCILTINGEGLLLHELERTVKEQRLIVKDLRQNIKFLADEVSRQSRMMMRSIDNQASIIEDKDAWDGIPYLGGALDATESILEGVGSFFGMGSGDDPKEAARIRTEAATAAYERSEKERRELMTRVQSESGILTDLSKQLALKRKDLIDKETHIARLKVHIKDNILHYMQAIWNSEHRDQRFFRLLDTKVPSFDGNYRIRINRRPEAQSINDLAVSGKTRHSYTLEVNMRVKEVTLKEVADLDNMLGYKGNYMIFPLSKSNALTDYMMAPYIDSEFGLMDPDNIGNWSLDDFEKFVKCLRAEMGDSFSEVEENLQKFYKQLLMDPLRSGDIITVPTDSLFIEALPGSHTILEYFKLAHRYMDVKKAQAEVRGAELENLRYAARILDKEHEDPRIDKKIVYDGPANAAFDLDN